MTVVKTCKSQTATSDKGQTYVPPARFKCFETSTVA